MIDPARIVALRQRLEAHPIYAALKTVPDLAEFMQHHVYSVWDFMSLIKYLQNAVAPARWPWTPAADPAIVRFINELVLEEESDTAPPGQDGYTSHFALYLAAMREVGADAETPQRFVERVAEAGLEVALAECPVPLPAARFVRNTFEVLGSERPHAVAAALALGREHVIPSMFRAFLARMGVTPSQAPRFHYYLNRHVHLDEDFHAPLSLRLLASLCADHPVKWRQAEEAAQAAVDARLAFWDGVLAALPSRARGAA